MLTVQYAFVRGNPRRRNSFYGTAAKKMRSESAWRVIVDNQWALRPGFKRKVDAEMARHALEQAKLDTGKTITDIGWRAVEKVMFEGLAW